MSQDTTPKMQAILDAIDAGGGFTTVDGKTLPTLKAMERRGLVKFYRMELNDSDGLYAKTVVRFDVRRP